MIPRIFEGDTAVVVAGGASLRGFDFSLLRNRRVVAINRAHEYLPDADVLWWTDARYWRRAYMTLQAHAAPYKATGNIEYHRHELPPGVTQYLFTGPDGFDEHPEHLRHGWNSAYAATHLAVHLGAKKIVLLGVDLTHDGTRAGRNFHSGYDTLPIPAETMERWKASFSTLAPILAAKDVEVINGSPNSALTIWPSCTPADALSA